MPIPESQLEVWTHQAPVRIARLTYAAVARVLNKQSPRLQKYDFELYLQGSYRNSTNIWADGDVDIIAELNTSIWKRLWVWVDENPEQFYRALQRAHIRWNDFRSDLQLTFEEGFGRRNIDPTGNNSLKLKKTPRFLGADIIPCFKYHHPVYVGRHFPLHKLGIQYFTQEDDRIVINYPKIHYMKGVAKSNRTNSRFKPTVRLFKNARTYLAARDYIDEKLAPSYYVQCLLYNVPDHLFQASLQSTYFDIMSWLYTADLDSFKCQNEQLPLFGDTPQQWSTDNAVEFFDALTDLWNNWY